MNFQFANLSRAATMLSSVVFSFMISRSCFIGIVFTVWLGASCGSALCAGPDDQNGSGPAQTTGGAKQSGDASNVKSDSSRTLSPNDGILVTVYGEDDLTTKTIIDKNGMVMLPLLRQVKISGMTVGEAQAQIQQL